MTTVVLTAVLVAVTAFYAWQTYRMAAEMRQDRRERATPRVVVDLRSEGAGFVPPSVVNVGLGPALDLDVTMTYVARDSADLTGIGYVTRRWRSRLVAPGERHRFSPPTDAVGQPLYMDRVSELFRAVQLNGTCRASFGETLQIDEEVGDLAEVWELAQQSWHLVDHEPDERIVKELQRIAKVLAKLVPKPTREELRRSSEASKGLLDEYFSSPEGQAERARLAALPGASGDVDAAEVEDPAPAAGEVHGHADASGPKDAPTLVGEAAPRRAEQPAEGEEGPDVGA